MSQDPPTIREGAWDCPACGRVGNRGPVKHCSACGKPRGPEVPFYLPEEASAVEDSAAQEQARAGADWNCQYCGAETISTKEHCHACGAARGDSPQRPVTSTQTSAQEQQKPKPAPRAKKRRSKPGCLRQGCTVGCFGLLLLFIASLLFDPTTEVTATPYGYEWEQRTEIEHQVRVTESAWEDEVPAAAQLISSSQELFRENKIRTGTRTETRTINERRRIGTERVKVGTKDLGNGYFEDVFEERPIYENVERTREIEVPTYRVEPIYKNKVRYSILRWRPHRTHRAFGTGRPEVWPDPDLAENERETERKLDFVVQLRDANGKIYEYRAKSEGEWRKFRNSKTYRFETIGSQVRKILW